MYIKFFLYFLLFAQISFAQQRMSFGCIDRFLNSDLKNNTYSIHGKKMYMTGLMNGLYIRNYNKSFIETGIWSHPMKLMEGYYISAELISNDINNLNYDGFFSLYDEPGRFNILDENELFYHDFCSCRFNYKLPQFDIVRTDFIPEDESAIFTTLEVTNKCSKKIEVKLSLHGEFCIQPGWSTGYSNGKDSVFYDGSNIVAFDKACPNMGLVLGSDFKETDCLLNDSLVKYSGSLLLSPYETKEVTFLLSGDYHYGIDGAKECYNKLFGHADSLLNSKRIYYDSKMSEGVQFTSSNKNINEAFNCAKANLLLGTMDVRPMSPDLYLGAGNPIYSRLFGTDYNISANGVAASGFIDLAKGNINCLLKHLKEKGSIPHETSSNGLFLGIHYQVPFQFVSVLWNYYKWSGDKNIVKDNYIELKMMVEKLLSENDKDNDGFVEGPGLMEEAGMFEERLVVATSVYEAFFSLSEMAKFLGNDKDYELYSHKAKQYKEKFNQEWWYQPEEIWASSLGLNDNKRKTMSNFWSVIFPALTNCGFYEYNNHVLKSLENSWVNDEWGLISQKTKRPIKNQGVGVVANNLGAIASFKLGFNDLGYKLINLSTKAPLEIGVLGYFDEVMPSSWNKLQLWSYATFIDAIVSGLCGINPSTDEGVIDIFPKVISGLNNYRIDNVRIKDDIINMEFNNLKINYDLKITKKTRSKVRINLFLPIMVGQNIEINGKKKVFSLVEKNGLKYFFTKIEL